MEDFKGKLICIDATGVTTANPDGSHHTRSVTKDTAIVIDGKKASASDLQERDNVVIVGDPATSIACTRKVEKASDKK